MRRVIVIAVAGLGLAGCSSFSMDAFKSAPPPVTVQLESAPQGANAVTSLGPGCKTPCSVSVPAADSFTVTYTLNKFQPMTIPVQVIRIPGDFSTPATTTVDPNPVVAELQPAEAGPKTRKKAETKSRGRNPLRIAIPSTRCCADPVARAQCSTHECGLCADRIMPRLKLQRLPRYHGCRGSDIGPSR
jgi:hypothetical protein